MQKYKLFLPIAASALLLASCQATSPTTSTSNDTSSTPISTPIVTTSSFVDNHTYYTVTFNSQGGSEIESQRVMENNPVRRPSNPSFEGHSFLGWYTTETASENSFWNFDTDRVTANITLYAAWLEDTPIEEPTASLEFVRTNDGYEVSNVGDEERIIIPETYEGISVTSIGASVFARKQVTYVSIPDSVTSIGQNAFNNASSLVEVRINPTSNLTSIGNNAFSGNSSLENIYLPATLTTLGNNVFNNASSLNSIVVADENTHYYSTGSNLIERESQTLLRGSNTSVIPEGVITIASAAFRRSSIQQIHIPASVKTIENYVFDDCTSLKEITVVESNSAFSSQSGVLYNKTMTELLVVPEGSSSTIIIPETITEIPSFSFDGLTGIPNIYIPVSVTNIRSFAFRDTTATIYYEGTEAQWNEITKHSTWGGANLKVYFNSQPTDITETNIYTIYFSATGNTKTIGDHIAEYTNSDTYEISALVPYTEEDLNYSNINCRANIEQNDSSARPEIGSEAISLDNHDIVYLGYPIWWGKAPKIIYTFLDNYDLSGKIIIPFCTSGSSSIGGSLSDLRALEPDATWLSGQRFSNNASASTIQSWVDSLEY